jgi:PPOX class probable F420-dependent enzyme
LIGDLPHRLPEDPLASNTLDGAARAIVADKNYAHLAVPRGDGTILAVVIWSDVDADGNIIVNSAEGRTWPRLLRRAGQATLSWANASNPYEFVAVTARLVGDTTDGADDVIDALAKKYMGVDVYPGHSDGETRVTFTLQPQRVTHRT